MFEWNVEEMKLREEWENLKRFKTIRDSDNLKFKAEDTTSKEDKIEFVDKFSNGGLSYLLGLLDKFKADRETLPKEKNIWGVEKVKTVSLRAWIKRNDTRNLIDYEYDYGSIRALERGFYIRNTHIQSACDNPEEIINQFFHKALTECVHLEEKYFRTHDEYSILTDEIVDRCNHQNFYSFGLSFSYGTSGILIYDDNNGDGSKPSCRKPTTAELKKLLELNNKVEEYVQSLAKELDFSYEVPLEDEPAPKKSKKEYVKE